MMTVIEETKQQTAAQTNNIAEACKDAFTVLVAQRDEDYQTAIAPLDAEKTNLEQESRRIEEAARSLEMLLPARAREAQRQADVLLLDGKHEQAQAKIAEMREAERAPEAMRARQSEICDRIEAIEAEKRVIAKRIFEEWYRECQSVVRAAEHGLFIVLLNGLYDSFFQFQTFTDTAAKVVGQRELFDVGHIVNLTADEHSAEWNSGSRWYAGSGGR